MLPDHGFLADINPNSEQLYPDATIETGFEEIRRRASWPAEAGENSGMAASKTNGDESINRATARDSSFPRNACRLSLC